MIHLAIDNSELCSVALDNQGRRSEISQLNFGRESDRNFLPFLRKFLSDNGTSLQEITHWSIGTGPGSFAGIRFSLALVKGICTVTRAKSRGIPASYALAYALNHSGNIAILQDARCGKVFYSPFQVPATAVSGVSPVATEAPQMLDYDQTAQLPCDFAATPAPGLKELLPEAIVDKLTLLPPPEAKYLLDAPESQYPWLDTPEVEPLYVRPPA